MRACAWCQHLLGDNNEPLPAKLDGSEGYDTVTYGTCAKCEEKLAKMGLGDPAIGNPDSPVAAGDARGNVDAGAPRPATGGGGSGHPVVANRNSDDYPLSGDERRHQLSRMGGQGLTF